MVILARWFYGLGIAGIGLQHFFFGQFIPVVVPLWPVWIPGGRLWVYCVGAALLVCAGAILTGVRARTAALLLGGVFLFSVLVLHVPAEMMAGWASLGAWTNAFKALTLAGGALVVAGSLPEGQGRRVVFAGASKRLITLGRYGPAITMVAFGIDHFLYAPFVAMLVPGWIPGHLFWTYFAGVALIASGLGMIFRVQARLAAMLLGMMIFLWLLVLHIPRAVADPYGAIGNEVTSVFEALTFSGIAFLLWQTLPVGEWLFVRGAPGRSDAAARRNEKHSFEG
jgi:uncharacterized membrane protein